MGAIFAPIAVGGQLLGAGISAYGAYESGQANAAALNYQAQVAEYNAGQARQNAQWEMQAADTSAINSELKTRAAVGATKAGQAASGIDVNSGSAPEVRAGMAEFGMLDALNTRSTGARQAYGYEVAATSDEAQAALDKAEASQAKTAGGISAISSLISGASGAASKAATLFGPTPPPPSPTLT
jgi:hypothetical protein